MRIKTAKLYFLILTILVAMMTSEVFFGVCVAALLRDEQTAFNTTNLIRLHIMANSDSVDDQALKLVIRDTVLREVKGLLVEAATKHEVWQILSESLNRIEDAARNEISSRGKDYGVTVELGTFTFPPCSYGDLQVPAGDYDAIRVMLGSGRGRNWWCVLFPPLCFIQVADNGRIQGLDGNTSPGEALLRLNLSLSASHSTPRVGVSTLAIPVLDVFASSTRLPLSLTGLI
ncbi:MAG: stage II sporulation protein R [Firmicutes bacterium]|nr:stage II sporulation protein R [Bacillota bacterium]